MAVTHKWVAPEAAATVMTTALDGLANGAYSAVSTAIANETGLYPYMAVEVYLASLTPAAGGYVALYLLPTVDATNYEDGGGAVAPPTGSLIAMMDLRNAAAAQRRMRYDIPIPPLGFYLVLYNGSGVALAANSNTIKTRRYYDAMV